MIVQKTDTMFSTSGKSKLDRSEISFIATRSAKSKFSDIKLERIKIHGGNKNW